MGESLEATKKSLTAYKGHLSRATRAFDALLKVKPHPTLESLEKANNRVQKQLDACLTTADGVISMLENLDVKDGTSSIDVDSEMSDVTNYYDKLLMEQCRIETSFVELKQRTSLNNPLNAISTEAMSSISQPNRQPTSTRPNVRLTALEPPTWNGSKADFYTWQQKFLHIMEEAQIRDELTQLCYLQNQKTLPSEYQVLISDCSTISEAWGRLEERVPKETIKFEIISQFRNLKPLTSSKKTPSVLRNFANEISLFCRRMSDIGIKKENYSCIILQDVFERLDLDTSLRYRSKMELKRELLQSSQEVIEADLDSICKFIRSEATTLELSHGVSQSDHPKTLNILQKIPDEKIDRAGRVSANYQNTMPLCVLGCQVPHRLIECPIYMNYSVEQRRNFTRTSSRCFVCLSTQHTARNCMRRKSVKCKGCSADSHHWTLCINRSELQSGGIDLPLAVPPLTSVPPNSVHAPLFTPNVYRSSARSPQEQNQAVSGGPQMASNALHQTKTKSEINDETYSPLVVAEVKTGQGKWIRANLFLDNGSNASLIRSKFAEKFNMLDCGDSRVSFDVAGGGCHYENGTEYEINVRPLHGSGEGYKIAVTGIEKPCAPVRPISSDIFSKYEHLKEYKNLLHTTGGEIDIMIGSDYGKLITAERTINAPVNPDDSPSIAFTRLGCYVYGGLNKPLRRAMNNVASINSVGMTRRKETEDLRDYFYNDVIGVKPTSTCVCSDNEIEESAFIKHVRKTTKINDEGRVEVSIPWRPGFPDKLPNNFSATKDQMTKRQKQCEKNGTLEIYNNLIKDLIARGVVRILSADETTKAREGPGWYLNHFIVVRLDKESTKYRLVFNSALPYSGICLNDACEKGPDYSNSIFRVFLQWRSEKIAVSGDMEKMFNQIATCPEDRKYHRFLWCFGDDSSPIIILEWERVLFGDKPSPDLAGYAIRYLSELKKEEHPVGAEVLKDNTYIDDVGFSVPTSADATMTMEEVSDILNHGKFSIKLWNSNYFDIDENCDEPEVDFLGHTWDKRKDSIRLKIKDVNTSQIKLTKRTLMGLVAQFWDPCGLLMPVTIRYRIHLQKLWQEGLLWDDEVGPEHVVTWGENIIEMQRLCNFEVQRCLKPYNAIGAPQLHAFSDGGDDAFGTCIFLRWETKSGFQVRFAASKAFVAPLKHKTTPRLELMGAVVMGRLVQEVLSALPYEFEFKVFWIDSEVVIHWVNSISSKYKPFVSSRIQEFQDTHIDWKKEVRYVPSTENPADSLTKPIQLEELESWHQGDRCKFLLLDEVEWPQTVEGFDVDSMKPLLEEKPARCKPRKQWKRKTSTKHCSASVNAVHADRVATGTDPIKVDAKELLLAEFSSWSQLKKGVTFMKKALSSISFNVSLQLCPMALKAAEKIIFLICQSDLRSDLSETRKRFLKLDPVLDDEGIIRANGRLGRTTLPEESKHPVILPGEHHWVRLLAIHHHKKMLHQGHRVVIINLANEGILIGSGIELLKSIAEKCFYCRTRRRLLLQQQMGTLPSFRITVKQAPFSSVAIDLFGFLKIKQSRNASIKGSVMIVTCMTTRTIHLELCTTSDTDCFIRAWRRFTSVRGVHPNHAFSDGGKNFIGAEQPLIDWIRSWDTHAIQSKFETTAFVFKWDFNVPTASHMNGAVESLIKSVRKGLDAAIKNYTKAILTYEDWATVLYEITYIINSRPLYPNGDPWEFKCVTANNILHPYGQPDVPQFLPGDIDNLRGMLRNVEGKVESFWQCWLDHMPPQLNVRNKWYHPRSNLDKGDYVLIFEKGMKNKAAPRSLWKKAIVVEPHPGTDGLVRSATVKDCNHNTYVRPVTKLALVATRAELEEDIVQFSSNTDV